MVPAEVYVAKQVRSRCARFVVFAFAPAFAQHLCLEAVKHRHGSVVRCLLDNGSVDELCQCVMCLLIR